MAKKQFDFSEALASSMDSIMNDEEYRRLFDAPKVATASVNYGEDPVGDAVQTLLLTSQLLEEMGLKKSASKTLETINTLIAEAMDEENDEEEDKSDADDKDVDKEEEDKSDADDKDMDEEEDKSDADDSDAEGVSEGDGDGEEGAEVDVSFADDKDKDEEEKDDDKADIPPSI